MARRFGRIITAALALSFAAPARAQDAPTSPPPDASEKAEASGLDDSLRAPKERPGRWRRGGDADDARRLEKLSPEQRERFRENLQRWESMAPEQRKELRNEEQRRRERIDHEIDETLKKAGLELSADQRQVYALRYMQERRKIEETLRREMDAKRRPMLDEMTERLKREMVSTAGAASASPAAPPSPSPK
jgi:hypothetical protein